MYAYTMLHIKIHCGRKQRAKNVNNNVAIWVYREATTLFTSLTVPLCSNLCLSLTAQNNNLICEHAYTVHTQLLLKEDGQKTRKYAILGHFPLFTTFSMGT